MALDRQSIERKDFPTGQRGYDPDAVDAHLSALAAEVEEFRREARRRNEAIASAASEQVRAIVEAAERSAAEIERQAEADGQETRREADREAQAIIERAQEEARVHVTKVVDAANAVLQRLERMEHELGGLTEALGAGRYWFNADIAHLRDELAAVSGPAVSRPQFHPESGRAQVAPEGSSHPGVEAVASDEDPSMYVPGEAGGYGDESPMYVPAEPASRGGDEPAVYAPPEPEARADEAPVYAPPEPEARADEAPVYVPPEPEARADEAPVYVPPEPEARADEAPVYAPPEPEARADEAPVYAPPEPGSHGDQWLTYEPAAADDGAPMYVPPEPDAQHGGSSTVHAGELEVDADTGDSAGYDASAARRIAAGYGDTAVYSGDDQVDAQPAVAESVRPYDLHAMAPVTAGDDSEGARLIALNMALNGTPREETERYLNENFQLADARGLLEEVYASVEG